MQRLIEFIETELQIVEAVLSRRIRSFVPLLAAIFVPPVVILVGMRMLAASPVQGLAQSFGAVLPVLGLVLTLKLLFLAMQTYLKDRAALLRF